MNSVPLTLEAWVRPITRNDGGDLWYYPNNIISNDLPGEFGHGFGATVLSNGISGLTVQYNDRFLYMVYPFLSGHWYHISTVYIPGNVKTYINGKLISDYDFKQANMKSQNLICIGKHNDDIRTYGTRRFFKGDIDEVRIWSRALCQVEIESNMHGELQLPQNRLMGYYKFNQGVANGNNQTITNLLDASEYRNAGVVENFILNGSNSNWVDGKVSGTNVLLNSEALCEGSPVISDSLSISVFPNPAEGIVLVNGNLIIDETATLTVYDAIGQLKLKYIFKPDFNAFYQYIDVSVFVPGIYLITLAQGDQSKSLRVVKR